MRNKIIENLSRELTAGMKTQAQVVYIMVEIRKYLDHTKSNGRYKVLRMFCDWVVHISLTHYGKGTLLEDLDRTLAKPLCKEESSEALRARHDFFSFENLKVELGQFLSTNGLPADLVHDGKSWAEFLSRYTSIVSECPLVYHQASKTLKSAKLSIYQLSKDPNDLTDQCTVAWGWHLTLNDGSKRSFSCSFAYAR